MPLPYPPLNTPDGPNSVMVGRKTREFSDFSEHIDLVAIGPTGGPARAWVVLAASESAVLKIWDGQGDVEELSGDLLVGIPVNDSIQGIHSDTNITKILVSW